MHYTLGTLAVPELNIEYCQGQGSNVTIRTIHAYHGCIGYDGVEYIDKDEEEGDK